MTSELAIFIFVLAAAGVGILIYKRKSITFGMPNTGKPEVRQPPIDLMKPKGPQTHVDHTRDPKI